MPQHRVTIVVYGLRTYLGREVARFGRAMGHRMVAVVDGQPPVRDEPWMHGIHWMTGRDPLVDEWPDGPPAAIVYCDTALHGPNQRFRRVLADRPIRLAEDAARLTPRPRLVLRSTIDQPLLPTAFTRQSRRAETAIAEADLEAAILRCPVLYGPDRPDSVAAMMIAEALARMPTAGTDGPPAIRVETAALAALRGALEPDMVGTYGPAEIARIGDVMIPQ